MLSPERIAALDKVGMVWDVPDYIFETNYASAVQYHRVHGDLNVPVEYIINGVLLNKWVNEQIIIGEGRRKNK